MGFSLSSFLGGAAKGGSQILDERRDQARRDKETTEAQQWQIATEGRADARSRKSKREARKKDTEEKLEQLTFYFGAENAAKMAPNGNGYIAAAIKQGEAYNAAGYDASTMVSMGEKEEFTKVPKVTGATPAALSTEASSITFKPLPQKAAKEKVSWEARLVSLVDEENALGVIGDDPAQQAKMADIERRRKNTVKQHAAWKADNVADGVASTAMDWSKQSRNAFIDGVAKRVGRKFDLVETSLDTGIERLLNPAEGLQRIEYLTAVDRELKAGYLDAVTEKDRDKSMANLVNNHMAVTEQAMDKYKDTYEFENGNPFIIEDEKVTDKVNTEIVPMSTDFGMEEAYQKYIQGGYTEGQVVYFYINGELNSAIAGTQGLF